jgi:hypothetical protein
LEQCCAFQMSRLRLACRSGQMPHCPSSDAEGVAAQCCLRALPQCFTSWPLGRSPRGSGRGFSARLSMHLDMIWSKLQEWLVSTQLAQPLPSGRAWLPCRPGTANLVAASLSRIHACVVDEAKLWREAGRSSDADLMHRPREPY